MGHTCMCYRKVRQPSKFISTDFLLYLFLIFAILVFIFSILLFILSNSVSSSLPRSVDAIGISSPRKMMDVLLYRLSAIVMTDSSSMVLLPPSASACSVWFLVTALAIATAPSWHIGVLLICRIFREVLPVTL